jgi:UDP-glucose 4-epimerase
MTELMLADVAAAHPFTYGALRYFNVAGADPQRRSGQSTRGATHLIKVTTETALGQRDHVDIFGTDFPTPDGTGVRDYIHVTDLVEAHWLLLGYLRAGGASTICNCGYGTGYSVRQVIDGAQGLGRRFRGARSPPPPRRSGLGRRPRRQGTRAPRLAAGSCRSRGDRHRRLQLGKIPDDPE